MGKSTMVFGVYQAIGDVETGLKALRAAGFRNEDVSVLCVEHTDSKDLANEGGSNAGEGASGTGAAAPIRGALGVLAGIGVLAVPGIGPLIAAGPITSGLTGLTTGGALGGITGALIGMGVPEYEAKSYEGRIREGRILLSVCAGAPEPTEPAQELMKRTGVKDISFTTTVDPDFADAEPSISSSRGQRQ